LPKDLNTIAVGYGLSRGNVLTDPSLPVSNFKVSLQSLVSKTLHQEPVFSVQGYVSYYFRNLMWVSVNGTWFNGG